MKKYVLLILIAVLLTVMQMHAASAAQSDGYIHTNHFYAVSFDGEGDAIVRAQIDIENTLGQAISKVDLEIPGQAVIYRAVQEPYYNYQYPYYPYGMEQPYPDYYPYPAPQEYGHPIEYEKTLTSDSTLLTLNLWNPVQRGGSTTVVLFYKIPRYAEKDVLGNHQFDFKTIIDRQAILVQNMRVAVNVAEGQFLKGGEAKVDYRPNTGFMGEAAMTSAASADVASPEYRQSYYQIRYAEGLVKTASNLDSFESFHVKGTYGENWPLVNWTDVAVWLAAAALVLAGIALGAKRAAAALKGGKAGAMKLDTGSYEGIALISFASSVAVIVAVAVAMFLAGNVSNLSYGLQWLSIAIAMLGLLAAAAGIFLPALYVASKEGMVKGALTFLLTIGFLIALGVILAILFSIIFPPVVYYATGTAAMG